MALKIEDDKIMYTDFHPNGAFGHERGLGSNSEIAVLDDVIDRVGEDFVIGHEAPTIDRIRHLKKFGAKAGNWKSLVPGLRIYENIISYQKKLKHYVDKHDSQIEMVWEGQMKDGYSGRLYAVMAERQAEIARWTERHCPI
jgi:hypothetical protein